MPSIYILHLEDQLQSSADEGKVFPLLRIVDDTHLSWAFAVPKPSDTGEVNERRKNRLARAALHAMGFKLDTSPNPDHSGFDFLFLEGESLTDSYSTSVFDEDTLPDLTGNPANVVVRDPEGPEGDRKLKLKDGVETNKNIKGTATFGVDKFRFKSGSEGHFELRGAGAETHPFFIARLTLEDDLKQEFPSGTAPELTIEHNGVDGIPRCNNVDVVASGSSHDEGGNVVATIVGDIRHDRLTIDVATLVCVEPDATDPKLAIEVFPAISFLPNANLPVTVTISNDGVHLRLQPRIDVGDTLEPRLTTNRFKPCVRVTIRGPVIHADASATGALEALRLLEPAERKIGETVEQINDFLVYSFEVCLPESSIADQTLPEIFRFEKLGFEVPNWPRMDAIDLSTFLKQLIGGLPLPRLNFAPRRIDFSLEEFQLPGLELKDILSLPDNIPGWKLALRRLDAPDLELPIDSVELSGFTLTVIFSVNVDRNIELALQLPRFSLPSVTFPDVGLPALTEYDFRQFAIVDGKLKVTMPSGLEGLLPDQLPHLWTVRVKRPGGLEFDLKLTAVNVTGLEVEFTIEGELVGLSLRVGFDLMRIKWSIPFAKPSLSVNELRLDLPFPRLRLPEVQGPDGLVIDYRLLTIRARLNGVDQATYTINRILDLGTFKKLELNVPKVNGHYPDLEPLTWDKVTLEFGLDLSLPLKKCFLSDLLGDLGSVDFRLSVPRLSIPHFDFAAFRAAFGSLATPMIPLELVVRVPHPKKPKLEWDELKLVLSMRFDLNTFRLLDNRIYFFLPQRRAFGDANLAPRQVMDFEIFTLTFPNRPEPLGLTTIRNHDGYIDMTSCEFVTNLKYEVGSEPTPPPRIHAFFPGGLDPEAARLGREGVENLKKGTPGEKSKYSRFRKEYAKRFDLELDEVDPKLWPNTGPDRLMFRFNSNGLTFAANLGKTEVEIDSSGFSDDGGTDGNSAGLIKPFNCQPQEKQRELRSRVVIIDNELKEAGVYAKTEVPGVENLMAEVSVVLRQRQKGMLPDVLASMELERADEAPLAEFSIKLLELSLDRLELGLIWRMQEREWDYSIIADGTIGFTGAAALVPDLEGLRVPSIQVVGLDLRRMNLRQLRVPINLVKPVRFEILDGMFGVELGDLEIGWEFDGKIPKPRLLACELAKLTFKNPGALEVSVSVGGLHIEFDDDLKAHVKLPSSLGIEVALGTSAKFAGRVGWVETDVERYLFASGKLMLEGLPEVRGLLKFGTGLKYSGRREINLVLYGAMDLDEQLFSGAVVKSLGLGVGLNNRLAAIPPTPSADAILRRIDLVKPGEVEGWQFVREGGFYMSVIGSVTLASNLGEPDVLNAYVAALVVSIDTNFDLVAAGKLWLSCSVKGQKDNPNNPAFVGALVLSPRQRKLEVVLESRKNAYVEQNDLIKKLLDKGFVRFAFRMTPQLVDFHLAEVSYRDQMFGVDMEFRGEFRFAIFKRAVLLKNELSATGSISKSLSGGAGGFDLDGQAYLRLGYGGLLSDRGAMAYAFIEAGIRFRVSAWIEIGFSISFKICGKRYSKSWSIVFRTRVPELELTLRGHIAIADRGGFGGFELLVGINVPICGYRLNVTAGWAMNVELYQEVRSTVAAFEAELDAAVAALDQSESARINTESARRIRDLQSAAGNSFDQDELVSIGLDVPKADVTKTAIDPPSESWLLYSREIEAEAVALLLPAADARWLTPTMATITSITVAGNVATFDINPLISGLPTETTVRLVGLRAKNPLSAEHVAKINGSRLAQIENGTVTFEVTGIGPGTYQLLAGVWYIEETITGLSSQDHDTVPYLNEVERAVLRTGDWMDASLSGSILTTKEPHDFESGQRILLRPKGGAVIDPGMGRTYGDTDRPSATVLAVPISGEARKLDLIEFSSELEPSDWQFSTAIEIAPPWSARNRLAALRDHIRDDAQGFNHNAYREYAGAAAAWAETAGRAGDSEAVSANKAYAVVFDERYTSADPRFSPDDAPVAPGVLSTRFRPVDDVEAVGVDAVLEAARRFEEASVGVARQQLHEAFDLDTSEAIQQARAQATQLLVHRLSDPRGLKPGDRLEAPVVNHQADKVAYGWFCKITTTLLNQINPADQDVLFIRRAGGTAEPVSLAIPKTSGAVGVVPELLPIRQDFVIDESSEVRERGRVIVRLPIRYPEEVLRERPQDIGRLQIYRRIADGPEDLVFDQLRPDISRLDKKQVYSTSRQQFVDDPPELDPVKRQDFRFTANRVTNSSIRFDEQQSRLLLPDRTSAADKLHNFSCRIADQDRTITNAEHSIDGLVTLEFEPAIGDGEEQISLELIAEGLIVPRPVLISDEFTVTDRQFDSAELRAALGSGRAPMLRYSLRLLAEDDPGGPKSDGREPWSTPVPSFIPQRTAPLPNLALAIPVGSLLQSSGQGITFQLIDLSEETPKLVERNGRPISADEFEYWLDGDILRQSGFYAGEAADPTPPREGDGERVTLAAVNATNGLESTAGKVRVEVERLPSTEYFKLKDTTLAPGAAFRALFRLNGDTSVRSLRRLPILLVREFPKMWDSTVRYRVIDTAEIIPKADELSVAKGEAKPLLVDFSADDRYEAGRAAIRSAWPSRSLLDGGVELQFRDFDDSSMRSRTLVEVLEADEFSQSQSDFRDDTFWTPRPPDRVERYVSRVMAKVTPRDEAEFKELLERVYLWKRKNERTGEVKPEIDAIRRLVEASKALNAANNWNDYAKAVRMVQTALLSFEKSPLNLNRVATRQLIELLRLALRAVVAGNKVGATVADEVEDARTTNQSLLELLTRIEQSRAETVSDTDANDIAFLDRDTALKIAGIARRRIAIADEALALRRIEAIPLTASMRKTDSPELARLDNWDDLLADARSLAADKPLPMTESLVSRFLPQPADPDLHRNQEAAELCQDLINGINGLVTKIGELELERLVPRAAGLSELLNKLNEKIRDGQSNTPAGLLKRPHHELTTTRKEDGEIVAREVPLRALLPARARQAKVGEIPPVPDERLERLGVRAGHVATLFEHGNVAIWTTRGNSVHDKDNPMERVQWFATGASNIADTDVHAFELSEVAEGPRLLIAATFSSTADVQLWDAGEAKVLRRYGNGTGATFAHTPRGLEVAVVMGGTVLLETTEVPDPTKQVKFNLTQEVLDRLFNLYGVPEPIKNLLGEIKGQAFETEPAFRGRLAELEGQNRLRPYLQVVINQAQNPISVRPPLAFTDGGGQGVFSGPVSYHDEIHVVAAARPNEILFWRDLGRPENKTPFYRWTLTFNVHFVSWEDWGSLEENDPGSFFAALDTSGRLHIRRFDAIGTLVDTLEATEDGKDYLVSLDADGEVLSKLEISGLPEGRSEAITEFKEKIKQSSVSRAIKGDERSVLHSLASLITDLVPPTVTHIQPVTLPAGAGFVIATRDYPKALFFLSPVQRKPEPVDIRESAAVVTQLAVDRRELKTSAIIDGKVHVYDLLKLAEVAADLNSTHVAVLHGQDDGQDKSYLALPYAGTVKIHHLDKADPLQTLPKPEGFEAVETGNIVAITSALQTARTATAAGDPLSLFHLWERMGFAVDIAAQDKTTRLLTLKELRNKIDAAIDIMANYKAGHSIYVVEGEEPDAEFRDDRVGFSHVNLAVVPNEFLAACLQPNFDALKEWLKNRSIKLAQEVLPTDSLEEKARKEQENQRELEYIAHMTQLVGVPEPSRYGTVVGNTYTPPALPRGGELRLQPRSDRFVRVPASAGFSHWSWTLPDRKGHRMLVAARRVSRYEPLLRWSLNLHTRFDLAEEVPLKRVGSSETVHTVASPVSNVAVTLNSELEPSTGWQPLRIEFVEGPGTGQRREILSIVATTLKLDEGDPLLVELVANQSKCRVMDAAPGWRLVVIDAIHDPARGEGAKPLMVYQYPHSRKPRFSYQIPLDGMRATYNQISRVRTGYDGIEAAFRYSLPDRIDNPEAATLMDLLKAITEPKVSPTDPGQAPPLRTVTNVAGGAEPNVRLFRHERMVSLPGLPFFYRYRLDVRSAYKARTLEYDRSTAAERLPDDENASPPAQRLPASLGLNEMTLSPVDGQPGVFEAVLYVSANRDHLTREEARSEPAPVRVEVAGEQVQACDLPDFFMDYNLYRNKKDGDGSLPSLGDLFSVIGSIRMPWSPNFKVPSTTHPDAKKKPFVSVASGVVLVELDDGGGSPTKLGREATVQIERVIIQDAHYWRLRFGIANEPGKTILEEDKVYIQAIRDGKMTRAVKCSMPE